MNLRKDHYSVRATSRAASAPRPTARRRPRSENRSRPRARRPTGGRSARAPTTPRLKVDRKMVVFRLFVFFTSDFFSFSRVFATGKTGTKTEKKRRAHTPNDGSLGSWIDEDRS